MTRVAVIGAGIMGANHARVLRRLPEAEITLVVDPDEQRGRALAASVGAPYSADPAAVAAVAEAAVVAVPSEMHVDVGVPLLRAGVDLLVEKPIATTVEDADALIEAARDNDRILMVGHVERFNPAVLQLDGLVQDLLHIELTRMGPFSPRVTADVVLDLMIHDLELALALAGSDVERVEGMGRRERTDSLDLVTALIQFRNGVTANVTASRIGQTKIRRIELTQRQLRRPGPGPAGPHHPPGEPQRVPRRGRRALPAERAHRDPVPRAPGGTPGARAGPLPRVRHLPTVPAGDRRPRSPGPRSG